MAYEKSTLSVTDIARKDDDRDMKSCLTIVTFLSSTNGVVIDKDVR